VLKFVCADVSSQKFTCVRVTLVTVCCEADVKSCIRKLQDCGDLVQDWIYSKSYYPSIESCILMYLHIDVNKYDFNVFVEFNVWKQQEEDVTMSRYIKTGGDCHTRRHQSTLRRYYCNRSGRYVTKGNRLRHMKVQGTCKIGSNCPAAMFAKISSAGKYKYVKYALLTFYIKFHCNKWLQLDRLRFP